MALRKNGQSLKGRITPWAFSLIAGLWASFWGLSPGFAQPHAGAAEALFKEGIELAQRAKYPEAISKLKASFALDPARGTLLALAMAEERAGKVSSAYAHYQDLSALASKAGDSERLEKAQKHLSALQPQVPTLRLKTAKPLPQGTQVLLDGAPFPLDALHTPIPLDPGEHQVLARSPQGTVFSQSVQLTLGANHELQIVLPSVFAGTQSPGPEPQSGSALRTTGYVLGGLGIVGLGVGTALWLKSQNTYDELDSSCPQRACPDDPGAKADQGRKQENWARVSFLAGGLGLASGITLLVLGAPSQGPSPKAQSAHATQLWAGPGSVGLRGSF